MSNYIKKKSNLQQWITLFLFVVFIGNAFGCAEPEAPKGEGRKLVLPVQIGKVVYRDVVDQIRVVGNIRAEQRVSVPSEIAGQISSIPVDEGTKVKQGALIASIDSREYVIEVERLQADLISADKEYQKSTTGLRPEEKEKLQAQVTADKSSLELAQKGLKRTEKLVAEGVVSQALLDEAIEKASRTKENLRFSQAALTASARSRDEDISKLKSDLDSTQKKLDMAKLNLSKARIRAPFSGVIISKNVDKGAYVSRGMSIVEMIGSSNLKAVIEIPQFYRGKLDRLKEIDFYISDMELRFKINSGFDKLVRVIPDANIFSGNVSVQIDLPKPDPNLFPGLTLEARLSFDTRRNILHVPSISLSITEQGSIVYVVKDGKAHIVPVKTNKERDDYIEIEDFTHQLNSESALVLRGSGAVFPGASVMVTNPPVDDTKKAPGPENKNNPGEKPATKKS